MKIEKELSEIRKVYNEANYSEKKVIERLYSKAVIGSATDRVISFETACKDLNVVPEIIADRFQFLTTDEIAYAKLKVIAQALNEGWTPDWSDDGQPKYFPWFDFLGSRFVFDYVYFCYAGSFLGSRLCFRTRELADYAGRQFEDLYHEYFHLE